jgi:hypothetical protein
MKIYDENRICRAILQAIPKDMVNVPFCETSVSPQIELSDTWAAHRGGKVNHI